MALWKAVKGAVNLEEEGEGRRPTRKHASTGLLGGDVYHSLAARTVCCNLLIFFYFGLVDVSLQLPCRVFVRQAAPLHQI